MTKVTLKQGILRGEKRITEIEVRKPLTKQLRGTNISALLQMNVEEWCIVLPRITLPKVDKADFATMNIGDLLRLTNKAVELMSEDFDEADEEDSEEQGKGKILA
ncbi:phage tail assembly protein [Mannheimia indoligenes]|uniref:phage tail assembly protein n=1 Tax=Mannheimia indoligenes TaxID=3103145 RepID=UPI002FE6086E